MAGETYSGGNYTDYDPESPRPTGLFPSEGGQQRGFGDFGVPPPPPPTMNLPGSSMAFGASRIPGPPTESGATTGMPGPPPPAWPPSRMPVTSKPPLGGSSYPVHRTSSIQSEGWTNRGSIDQHGGGMDEPLKENTLGLPPMMIQREQGLSENSSSRPPLQSSTLLTNSGMKKPPPAIAKESPLKALYAKGAENYDGNRRKISLKVALDSVATNAPVAESKDEPSQPISGSYPPSNEHAHVEHQANMEESAPRAPEPAFFPFQQQGGSNHRNSQSFYREDAQNANVFNPMNPPSETTGPQYQEEVTNKALHEEGPPYAAIESPQRRKTKRLFKKRFILYQVLFLIILLFDPSCTITRMTVAGAIVQSGLAGYTMMDKAEFRSMLHAQFHEDTSAYQYIGAMENSFDLVHEASESAWATAVNTMTCESSRAVCFWTRNVLHAGITTGIVAQKTMVATYKNIPHALRAGKAMTGSFVSGKYWENREETVQSLIVEKVSEMQRNAIQLSRSTVDFTICTVRSCSKGGNPIRMSENILSCCMSSYEAFLKDTVPTQDVAMKPMPENEIEKEELQQEDLDQFDHEEEPFQMNQSHVDIDYDPDQYKIPDAYQQEPLQQIETPEEPLPPIEPNDEDAKSSNDVPVVQEYNVTDQEVYQEDMDKEIPATHEEEEVPPLDELLAEEDNAIATPTETLNDHAPVEENVTIPEYVEEPEVIDDIKARARRRLEKEKVLIDRKKRREAEKNHRSEKGDDASTEDVRSILSFDQETEGKTEVKNIPPQVPVLTQIIQTIQSKCGPPLARTRANLVYWSSRALDILTTNLTHIVTGLVSALIASLLFMIQGRRARSVHADDAHMDASTPRGRVTKDWHDEEPATVYKSAEPVEKKTRRIQSSRVKSSIHIEERPRQRSKTPRAKQSSTSTARGNHVEASSLDKPKQPARRSTRTRSSSRKAR